MQFILRVTERVKRRHKGTKESNGYLDSCVIFLIVRKILSLLFIYFFNEIDHF